MDVYLGERYLPGTSTDQVIAGADRVRAAAAALAGEGVVVRLLSTTFVPSEEWVFDLFEAEAAGAVQRAYARAHVTVERITDAVRVPAIE
jgi:hypothetical protein